MSRSRLRFVVLTGVAALALLVLSGFRLPEAGREQWVNVFSQDGLPQACAWRIIGDEIVGVTVYSLGPVRKEEHGLLAVHYPAFTPRR